MLYNPLNAIDFYKADHRRQYPEGTTEIYSNFTARYVKNAGNFLEDFDDQVVVFGLQPFLKWFLISFFQVGFFERPKNMVVQEYKQTIERALGIDNFDCSHIEALHDLGYLPLRIKAIEEGYRVPLGVPILTVVNTHPDFFWLTNYIETALSASIWKPMTVATIAFEFKRLLTRYAKKTGAPLAFVPFQAHDFSFRGMSGIDDASICGAAHLTSFKGSDCVSAIDVLRNDYFAEEAEDGEIIACSVPATEHSVMCCEYMGGERATVKRLLTEIYPQGVVSVVADTYNLWEFITDKIPSLIEEIYDRQGKIVIRPDSGNPVDIICGDIRAAKNSPAFKGCLQLLWDTFSGRINEAGYKEINPRVGLIYGDAITLDRAYEILYRMEKMGFASNNIVFGVGSFTYQYITRDTLGFAMKATSAVIKGERRAVYKNPVTDQSSSSKKSARGLLKVDYDAETARAILEQNVSEEEEKEGFLVTVFEDGKIVNQRSLSEIRKTLELELEHVE